MNREIGGVICAMITPHDEDGSLNVDGLQELVDYLIDEGIDVIFPTGSAGEGPILSLDEKKEVASAVVEAVDGRVPVTPGIACSTTKETIEMGRYCDDLGVEAVVVVTPWYYHLPDETLFDYYVKVASEVESPIIVYKIPQCAVNDVSHQLLGRLAEVDGIYGMKDSSGDMVWLSEAIALYGDRLRFYAGNDRMILPSLSAGSSGHVSGSSNCFPAEVVEVWKAFQDGDVARARSAQQDLLRKVSLLTPGKENTIIREILRMKGIETGEPLPPMSKLTEEESESIRAACEELDSTG